jgi:Flp pilus assembly protein CpaB
MGRGRFLMIVGGLFFLAMIGLVAFYFLTRGGPAPPAEVTPEGVAAATEEPTLPTRKVLIAIQDIPSCTEIPPDAVTEWEVPMRDIPDDVVLTKEEILGPGMHPIAMDTILRGQPVAYSVLSSRDEILRQGLDGGACLIPKGKVAVAFPVEELSSVAYALQPGDRVDVLISASFVDLDAEYQMEIPVIMGGGEDCLAGCQPVGQQWQRATTQLTVQNAEVLMVGPWGEGVPFPPEEPAAEATPVPGEGEGPEVAAPSGPTTYNVVILMVSPQDALVLKWVRENRALIDLALRSGEAGGDQDQFTTEPVTLEYMTRRFGIAPPPKLGYGMKNETETGYYGLPGSGVPTGEE